MHKVAVFTPILKNDLTLLEKSSRRRGTSPSRDGSVQMAGSSEGTGQSRKPASPTISMESVFLTSVIDVHERRDVAC
jgi:hypothetical protein